MARRTAVIPADIRSRVLDVMDCLGGDDFSYYNIDPKSISVGSERSKIRFSMKVLVNKASRSSATDRVKQALINKGLAFRSDKTKPNQIDILAVPGDPNKIIRLDIKPTGGGSGAGAAETARNEATQALFCALRYMGTTPLTSTTIKESDLKIAYSKCDLKRASNVITLDYCMASDPEWIQSHIKGANIIASNHRGNFTFHRGSSLVSKIEEVYKECNKGSGSYFSDINKWSPADIYLVSNDFDTSEFDNISTLEVLNAKMKELFNSNKLIGISLKKITSNTAHYSVKNLDSNTRTKKTGDVEYRGYSSTFDSIDLYVKWGIGANDRIQFRNTGGDKLQWQGEIKGTSAAQGKVGGGVVDSILNNLGHSTLDLKTGHDELKRKTSPDYFDAAKISKEIFDFCVRFNITGFNNQPQFLDKIGMQSHSWRYSKYINLKLLDIIEGMTSEQKTEFVQSLYFYAASQSKLSAVYAKVE